MPQVWTRQQEETMRYLIEMILGFFIGKRNGGEYYFMEGER